MMFTPMSVVVTTGVDREGITSRSGIMDGRSVYCGCRAHSPVAGGRRPEVQYEAAPMTCRNCGTEIAAKALICYRCGKATTDPRIKPPAEESVFAKPRRAIWPYLVAAAGVAAGLAA